LVPQERTAMPLIYLILPRNLPLSLKDEFTFELFKNEIISM
jgi:hypothetical protein